MLKNKDLCMDPVKGKYQYKKRLLAIGNHYEVVTSGTIGDINKWLTDNQRDIPDLEMALKEFAKCIKDGVTHLIVYQK